MTNSKSNGYIKVADSKSNIDKLFDRISKIIEQARANVARTVDITEVYTKYLIGQYIVEYEQQGEARAQYGRQVLKSLSAKLTERFGDGWSYPNLKIIRQFYIVYSKRINSVYPFQDQLAKHRLANSKNRKQCLQFSENPNNQEIAIPLHYEFKLSWSQYLILMRIENEDERSFYEIECAQQRVNIKNTFLLNEYYS